VASDDPELREPCQIGNDVLVEPASQPLHLCLAVDRLEGQHGDRRQDCIIARVDRSVPVLFLDTFHHFPQTLAYRDELSARWGLNLINLRAKTPSVGLWQAESTEACCKRHKVEPLFSALEGYDTWFTALRRDQSASRANLKEVEPFQLPGKVISRVAPIAGWHARDVWKYAKDHDIPLLPLYELGYTSIGCEPCTTLPLDPNNPRSGRWAGEKLECGIHIQAK